MKEKIIVAISIAGFFGIMALSTKMNNNNLSTEVSSIDSSVLIKEIPQQNTDDVFPEETNLVFPISINHIPDIGLGIDDSFNIIDDVSAEKTISMWIQEEEVESNVDGSYDVQKSHGEHYYKLKQ